MEHLEACTQFEIVCWELLSSEREKWMGRGDWDDEPDWITFVAYGMRCTVRRWNGCLNGYVALPDRHPLADRHREHADGPIDNIYYGLEVHGGVTYSDRNKDYPMYGDAYCIGFDCNHSGDYGAGSTWRGSLDDYQYRNLNYVVGETAKLADQLQRLDWDLYEGLIDLHLDKERDRLLSPIKKAADTHCR